jgi:hypothetical protein
MNKHITTTTNLKEKGGFMKLSFWNDKQLPLIGPRFWANGEEVVKRKNGWGWQGKISLDNRQ